MQMPVLIEGIRRHLYEPFGYLSRDSFILPYGVSNGA